MSIGAYVKSEPYFTAAMHHHYVKPDLFDTDVVNVVNVLIDFLAITYRLMFCFLFSFTVYFYSARNARIASAVLATAIPSVCPSIRPSVRLSVCPSHAGIVSKRRHVARCSLHRWIVKCI